MARFLLCPHPERGDTYPTVPLARALRAQGHDVVQLTTPAIAPELAAAGLDTVVRPGGVYGSPAEVTGETVADWPNQLLDQVAALCDVVDEVRPDAIVDKAHPFGPRLVAELRGLRHASLHTAPVPLPSRGPTFPFGTGWPPPVDERGRRLAQLATRVRNHELREETAAWDRIRRELGLEPTGVHPWYSVSSRDLVLIARTPALEYPQTDVPSHCWFIGPLLWQPDLPVPSAVRALDGSRPIVYVSQGTTYNRNPLIIRRALEALADEPVRVVAGLGRDFTADELPTVPDNAVVEPFVPFSAVVSRIAVAVTHAGSGAVYMALSRGVPLVLLPLTGDQPELAARCVCAGAALRLDPWDTGPEELRNAVRAALDEPQLRAGARRVMASFQQYDAPSLGASLLDRLAATVGPVRRGSGRLRSPMRARASGIGG